MRGRDEPFETPVGGASVERLEQAREPNTAAASVFALEPDIDTTKPGLQVNEKVELKQCIIDLDKLPPLVICFPPKIQIFDHDFSTDRPRPENPKRSIELAFRGDGAWAGSEYQAK